MGDFINNMDSSQNAYLYNKALLLWARVNPDIVRGYSTLSGLLPYFRDRGDSLTVGNIYLSLGSISDHDIWRNYIENSSMYYRMADRAFADGGVEVLRVKNLINLAECNDSDSAFVDSIYEYLVNSDIAKADLWFYEIVQRNIYLRNRDIKYIDNNIAMLDGRSDFNNKYAFNLTIKGGDLMAKGRVEEGLAYSQRARELIDSMAPTYFMPKLYYDLSAGHRLLGRYDSAYVYYERMLWWRDSLMRKKRAAEVIGAEATMKLAAMESKKELASQRVRLVALVVIMAVIIVALGTGIVLMRRAKRHQIASIKAMNERDRAEAALTAETILAREKDGLISRVEGEVDALIKEGKMSKNDASRLTSSMRIFKSGGAEREVFKETHYTLSPSFMRRLKAECPSLSEGQLRMACYIAMGVSNARIADMLNLEANSVRVARYRMRKKLGLANGDSLEDFLRRYTGGD